MLHFIKKTRFLLTLSLILLSGAYGDESADAVLVDEDLSKIVRFGSWERALPNLYYRCGSEFLKISAPPYERGNALPLSGNQIRVYKRIGDGRGSKNFEELATFTAPGGAREVWVVLVASKSGELLGVVTADDSDLFGRGKLRVLNITPHTMLARLGEEDYQIGPLSARIVSATTDRKKRQFYALAVQTGEENLVGVDKSFIGIPDTYRCTLITSFTEGFGIARPGVRLATLPVLEYVPE